MWASYTITASSTAKLLIKKMDANLSNTLYEDAREKEHSALWQTASKDFDTSHEEWVERTRDSRIPVASFLCASLLITSFWWRQTLCPSARSRSLLIVFSVCVFVHGRQREWFPGTVSCPTLVLEGKLRASIKWRAGINLVHCLSSPT